MLWRKVFIQILMINPRFHAGSARLMSTDKTNKTGGTESERLKEFRKKLREKTPIGTSNS